MQKITPFLWFDDEAEEAANFYVSLFKNSKVKTVSRSEGKEVEKASAPAGSVMVVAFELEGQEFNAVNGGPEFKFTESISFVVNCETQDEVDFFWEQLSEGGTKGQCGWLKDRYGVSWQVVPTALSEFMGTDALKAKKVMGAMLSMTKIEIEELQKAYDEA